MVSKLDHCIVSQNLVTHFKDCLCLCDIDNSSDHFPLLNSFHIDIKHVYNKRSEKSRILWHRATDIQLDKYCLDLNDRLSNVSCFNDLFMCANISCDQHSYELQKYHDDVASALAGC